MVAGSKGGGAGRERIADKREGKRVPAKRDSEAAGGAGAGAGGAGAGGGGFMLIFAKPQDQPKIKESLKDFLSVPFEFDRLGSQVIVFQPETLGSHYPNHGSLHQSK